MDFLRKIDRICKVEQEAGWKGPGHERFSNKDLDPVPREKRTWGLLSTVSYWCSDQFSPSSWSLGASLIAMGLTAREAIPITFFGFFLCGIIIAINAQIGASTHCSFPVLIRASMGMWGSYPAILVRCILSLLWLAIQTYLAGSMTAQLIGAIWPSYLRLPNHFPEDLGITSAQFGGFMLYWAVQSPLAMIPVHKIRILFNIKAIICPIGYSAICFWALAITKGHAPSLDGPIDTSLAPKGDKGLAIVLALNSIAGLYSTLQVNIPDFTRFSSAKQSMFWQALVVPVTGTWPVACGIISTAAASKLYGVEAWDAATLVGLWGQDSVGRAARFFVAAMFLLSALGVNISANSISFATDMTAVLPRYLTIFRATILSSILCLAINPWKVVNGSESFYNFLQSYSVLLGPIACILFTDFYLVRKGRVDVRELYNPDGPFAYTYGVNWRAYAAWIGSVAPNLPGLIRAINPDAMEENAATLYLYAFGWGVGCVLAVVLYYVICLVFPPHASFNQEKVYEIDEIEETGAASSSDADLEKKDSTSAQIIAV
ncbi:uncharacterized protein JCM10292_004445 [Rhodotorula paludigena]|uniref:uncharacterized protein n=1 Tax=Rhodotorula paludigena TaxID=86838 RepID=UPI00317AC8D3